MLQWSAEGIILFLVNQALLVLVKPVAAGHFLVTIEFRVNRSGTIANSFGVIKIWYYSYFYDRWVAK
jgi:hypothetical protein